MSGWIDLEVTTKGYLSFADPERTWRYQCGNGTHRVSDFFTVKGHLVIPGSELRGMIRTNLEAVLDARAAILDEPPAAWKYEGTDRPFERCSYRLTSGNRVSRRCPGIVDINSHLVTPCRLAKIPVVSFEREFGDIAARSPHGRPIRVKCTWLHQRGRSQSGRLDSGEVVWKAEFAGKVAELVIPDVQERKTIARARVIDRLDSRNRRTGRLAVRDEHGRQYDGPELEGTGFSDGDTVRATVECYNAAHLGYRVVRMEDPEDPDRVWDAKSNSAAGDEWSDGYVCVPRDRGTDKQVSKYLLVFIPLEDAKPLPVRSDPGNDAWDDACVADRRFTDRSFAGPDGQTSLFVRYLADGQVVQELGAVGMFRSAEKYSWQQIVDRDRSLRPARTMEELDPVSRLFGWIPGDEGATDQGFMGRLSFEPLIGPEASDQSLTEWRTLPIRGMPKPQYYPFYLQGAGGGLGRYSVTTSRLRGRKFYWHFPKQKRGGLTGLTPSLQDRVTNQNATERLCKPDQSFRGRIYFTNLEPWELGALRWTMTFSANPMQPSQAHGHHLGGGAATGFGSVQLTVQHIYTVDHRKEWEGLAKDGITDAAADAAAWVNCFLTKIGPSIGLNDQGQADNQGSPIWDWLKGHELEALAGWPTWAIGYREGKTKDDELQAPAYYMKMRGRRLDARQGTEEPIRTVNEIALQRLGQEVVRERHQ
ncbi:MAG: hypothetical protein AB7Y46_02970 [Armatimonadota bacterium]